MTGYEAHSDTWVTSGKGIVRASDTLGDGIDALCASLAAAGAPWGEDDIGRAFFNGAGQVPGFGVSRDRVLTDLANMVNLVRGTGTNMIVAGRTYAAAEQASTMSSAPLPRGAANRAVAVVDPYRLPSVSSDLVTSDPPPAEWRQILGLLETLVGGCEWPDGNLSALSTIRDAFTIASCLLIRAADEVTGGAHAVTSNNSGAAAQKFASFAAALRSGGDEGGLLWLARACQGLADSVDTLIREKKAARLQFENSLAFLAETWALALAFSSVTGHGSVAKAIAVTQTEGTALKALLKVILKAVLAGMWLGGGLDAVGQDARIQEGLQDGFDYGESGTAIGEGALAGAVTGTAGGWVGMRGNGLSAKLADWMAAGGAKGVGARFGFDWATGTLGNIAVQAAFDDGHVDLGQAVEFGLGMAGLNRSIEAGRSLTRLGGPPLNPRRATVDEAIDGAAALRTDNGQIDPAALTRYLDTLPRIQGVDNALADLHQQVASLPELRDVHGLHDTLRRLNQTGHDALLRDFGETTRRGLTDFAAHSLDLPPDRIDLQRIGGDGPRGRSGAPVFIVRDSATGDAVAIVKLFPRPAEFANELSVIQRLNQPEFTKFSVPDAVSVGTAQAGDWRAPVITSSVAPGHSFMDLFVSLRDAGPAQRPAAFDLLHEATGKIAEAMGDLHAHTIVEERQPSADYMAPFRQDMQNFVDHITENRVWYECRGFDVPALKDGIQRAIADIERDPGPAGMLHGDPNPGNYFYDKEKGVTIIDLVHAHKTMDAAGRGVGASANDVQNFRHDLDIYGRMFNLGPDEFNRLWDHFRASYEAAGGPPIHEPIYRFFSIYDALYTPTNFERLTKSRTDIELDARMAVAMDVLREVGVQ